MAYDAGLLKVRITDLDLDQSTTNQYKIDIPGTLGGNSGYVGFTGATGAVVANEQIYSWKYVSSTAAPGLLSVIPTLNWLPGGQNTTGTVSIGSPLATAVKVALSSSSPAVVLPAAVVIPAGQTTATFPINTAAVGSTQKVVIGAALNGTTVYGTLQLHADGISSVSVLGNNAVEGSVQTGVVTLQTKATSDTLITLVSNNPAIAAVPATIKIPAGAQTVHFPIQLGALNQNTTVLLTATANGFSTTGSISVRPLRLTGIFLSNPDVLGGTALQGKVLLEGPAAAGGKWINLATENASASVPAGVLVPAGAISVAFPIQTAPITANNECDIDAFTAVNGVTTPLEVHAPGIVGLVLTPNVVAGQQAMGTLTLEAPATAGGTLVKLLSSNTGVATVVSTILVPAGQTTASFVVNTRKSPTAPTAVISASANETSLSTTLVVTTK